MRVSACLTQNMHKHALGLAAARPLDHEAGSLSPQNKRQHALQFRPSRAHWCNTQPLQAFLPHTSTALFVQGGDLTHNQPVFLSNRGHVQHPQCTHDCHPHARLHPRTPCGARRRHLRSPESSALYPVCRQRRTSRYLRNPHKGKEEQGRGRPPSGTCSSQRTDLPAWQPGRPRIASMPAIFHGRASRILQACFNQQKINETCLIRLLCAACHHGDGDKEC